MTIKVNVKKSISQNFKQMFSVSLWEYIKERKEKKILLFVFLIYTTNANAKIVMFAIPSFVARWTWSIVY